VWTASTGKAMLRIAMFGITVIAQEAEWRSGAFGSDARKRTG